MKGKRGRVLREVRQKWVRRGVYGWEKFVWVKEAVSLTHRASPPTRYTSGDSPLSPPPKSSFFTFPSLFPFLLIFLPSAPFVSLFRPDRTCLCPNSCSQLWSDLPVLILEPPLIVHLVIRDLENEVGGGGCVWCVLRAEDRVNEDTYTKQRFEMCEVECGDRDLCGMCSSEMSCISSGFLAFMTFGCICVCKISCLLFCTSNVMCVCTICVYWAGWRKIFPEVKLSRVMLSNNNYDEAFRNHIGSVLLFLL